MITADHGPAVSGAHNTIITARAGKDLVSSLVSGLVTIGTLFIFFLCNIAGPRFGGAIDDAAIQFSSGSISSGFTNEGQHTIEIYHPKILLKSNERKEN